MRTDVYKTQVVDKGLQCGGDHHGAAKALFDGKSQNTGVGECNLLVSGQTVDGDTSKSQLSVIVDLKGCKERKNLYKGSTYDVECLLRAQRDKKGSDIYKEMCQAFYDQLPNGSKHGESALLN